LSQRILEGLYAFEKMREITEKEYLDFVEKNKFVEIGKEKISLEPIKV